MAMPAKVAVELQRAYTLCFVASLASLLTSSRMLLACFTCALPTIPVHRKFRCRLTRAFTALFETLEVFIRYPFIFLFISGLGFNIRGGKDNIFVGSDPGIFVAMVRPDGAAAKDGRLQAGDKILEVSKYPHY